MRRLFLQIYGGLVLVLVLCLALVVAVGLPGELRWDLDENADFPTEATRDLAGLGTQAELDAACAALADRFGHPVELLPREVGLASLDDAGRSALTRGEPVTTYGPGGAHLFVPLAPDPSVVRLGPVPPPARPHPLTFGAIAGLVLVALVMWLAMRGLERQLGRLSDAAHELGRGQLSRRAELPPGAPLGPLARSFNEMAERLEQLVHSRQELLDGVSHELRGPLQRLRFAVELLEGDTDADARAKRTGELQRDLGELEQMVEELLTWSRMQASTLAPQAVELGPLLAELADAEGRNRPEIAVDVDAEPGLTWVVDRRLFRRAVRNLVCNAIRHSARRVRIEARASTSLRVVVEDDGPGIPMEKRDKVLEPFVRLDDARHRDGGGVGLGLAIAQRVAASHGGELTVEDSALGGAAFVLVVPDHRVAGRG